MFLCSRHDEPQPVFRFVGRPVDHGTHKLAEEFLGRCVARDQFRRTADTERQHQRWLCLIGRGCAYDEIVHCVAWRLLERNAYGAATVSEIGSIITEQQMGKVLYCDLPLESYPTATS